MKPEALQHNAEGNVARKQNISKLLSSEDVSRSTLSKMIQSEHGLSKRKTPSLSETYNKNTEHSS